MIRLRLVLRFVRSFLGLMLRMLRGLVFSDARMVHLERIIPGNACKTVRLGVAGVITSLLSAFRLAQPTLLPTMIRTYVWPDALPAHLQTTLHGNVWYSALIILHFMVILTPMFVLSIVLIVSMVMI